MKKNMHMQMTTKYLMMSFKNKIEVGLIRDVESFCFITERVQVCRLASRYAQNKHNGLNLMEYSS